MRSKYCILAEADRRRDIECRTSGRYAVIFDRSSQDLYSSQNKAQDCGRRHVLGCAVFEDLGPSTAVQYFIVCLARYHYLVLDGQHVASLKTPFLHPAR